MGRKGLNMEGEKKTIWRLEQISREKKQKGERYRKDEGNGGRDVMDVR